MRVVGHIKGQNIIVGRVELAGPYSEEIEASRSIIKRSRQFLLQLSVRTESFCNELVLGKGKEDQLTFCVREAAKEITTDAGAGQFFRRGL